MQVVCKVSKQLEYRRSLGQNVAYFLVHLLVCQCESSSGECHLKRLKVACSPEAQNLVYSILRSVCFFQFHLKSNWGSETTNMSINIQFTLGKSYIKKSMPANKLKQGVDGYITNFMPYALVSVNSSTFIFQVYMYTTLKILRFLGQHELPP